MRHSFGIAHAWKGRTGLQMMLANLSIKLKPFRLPCCRVEDSSHKAPSPARATAKYTYATLSSTGPPDITHLFAGLQQQRLVGNLPVKPNKYIEAWGTKREHIEETFKWDG